MKLKNEFPNLYREIRWKAATCRFEYLDRMPPIGLISNVSIVPFKNDGWLILRLQTGEWEIPGGILELGESYLDAIRRELIEEAGANLISFEPFGAWHYFSNAPKPYRPHLPHPEFYRLVGYGEVEITGVPTNSEGGETVESVEFVPIKETVQRFSDINRFDIAELYHLAARLRETEARPW